MSAMPVRYFAPTFFSPYYFPSLVSTSGEAGPVVSAYRDRDAFAAVIQLLQATGEFAEVSYGTTRDRVNPSAEASPSALIAPRNWYEADDVDPVELVRQVGFDVSIVVTSNDPTIRFDMLDRLSNVAENALNGSDLGGDCIPALTRLKRANLDTKSDYPEQVVVLHGEFAYLIPSLTGHNTKD